MKGRAKKMLVATESVECTYARKKLKESGIDFQSIPREDFLVTCSNYSGIINKKNYNAIINAVNQVYNEVSRIV